MNTSSWAPLTYSQPSHFTDEKNTSKCPLSSNVIEWWPSSNTDPDFRVRCVLFLPMSCISWEPPWISRHHVLLWFPVTEKSTQTDLSTKENWQLDLGGSPNIIRTSSFPCSRFYFSPSQLHSNSSLCLMVAKWLLAIPNWHPYCSCKCPAPICSSKCPRIQAIGSAHSS